MTDRQWHVTEIVGPLGGEPGKLDPPVLATPEVLDRLSKHWAVAAYHLVLLPVNGT